MPYQCSSHDIRRTSKKLCIKSFSFNYVVNGGIQCACNINIIKIFFTTQKALSKLIIIKVKNIVNNRVKRVIFSCK